MNDCPMCSGPPVLLGSLGAVTWLRCRDCGWQYMADGPLDDELDDDFDDELDDEDGE